MNNRHVIGYQEHEHTADWQLEVWAPDLPALLEQAARGMYTLAGARLSPSPRIQRMVELEYMDPESALVSFLEELLFLSEIERLGFDQFEIEIEAEKIQAVLRGAPIASQTKEIKAVTYHNLAVRNTERGLEVKIVFDV